MLDFSIPVIDLFAGPGGLGEGFSAAGRECGQSRFRICLSIEKDPWAHETLLLRHFLRMLSVDAGAREKYYDYIRTENLTLSKGHRKLFDLFPEVAARTESEVLNAELGVEDPTKIRLKITEALRGERKWVLIGGPPCQAYSIVGRSRNRGNPKYDESRDKRHQLYVEYLQILADHRPAVFIMENVTGLLSATLNKQRIFEQMVEDLACPRRALEAKNRRVDGSGNAQYKLYPLVGTETGEWKSLRDFVVCMENYGIPQFRHRIIILGLNTELGEITPGHLVRAESAVDGSGGNGLIPAHMVLSGLPGLRSGLSREPDDPQRWRNRIREVRDREWYAALNKGSRVQKLISSAIRNIREPELDRGDEFIPCDGTFKITSEYNPRWFLDPHLEGVCNHTTRIHKAEDLHRYLFAICYAEVYGKSPDLKDFPMDLLPNHQNVRRAIKEGHFEDRFRVLNWDRPSTTVTSHLAKDGHYFIHPAPAQCRSITVREAARLQTFPDNYFFCGPRTAQYIQVGNAVPPLIARQIADIVYDVLKRAGID